jgi:small ligand-binding sensory domain FIST
VFGGMASGASAPGESTLILDDDQFHEGAVAVRLSGAIDIAPVVSQGCRPIGKPFVITAADRNVIKQLGGRPALAVLSQVFNEAEPRDQKLLEHGVFIGRAISEYRDTFGRGDFLIRNVIGADKKEQTVMLADIARVGTTVQFHVRDADSADDDLRSLLGDQRRAPAGGLLFSCNGRGTRMYKDADHDVGVIHDVLGELPLAGLFCAGEIGPVGGQAFVHGHTASLALFRAK